MKILKVILAAVYVVLITLLLLFSCKGCEDTTPEPDDDDIEAADTIADDQDAVDQANDVGERGDLKITLLWEVRADIDLHVIEPNGNHIYFHHKHSATGGFLDVDNTRGGKGSAENIYWTDPPSGAYQVSVMYYAPMNGPAPVSCKVVIQARGQTPRVIPVTIDHPRDIVQVTTVNIP